MSASEKVKRVVWARAAGRCTICNKDLLSDHLGSNTVVRSIGEVAHIAAESMIGPRGDSTVEPEDRNEADNLMLLCPNEHTEADSGRLTDPIYTLDYLRRRKEIKEAWIKFVTGLDEDRRTTILRVSGDVRGAHGMISQTDAASIVMNESLRTPWYLPDPRGSGLTVDLTGIPGPGTPSYWSSCVAQIEAEIARLHMSAKDGSTTHVSVFGFALVPVLVALGYMIDDTIPTAIYERHRSTDSWAWDRDAQEHHFVSQIPETTNHSQAALLVSASGSINDNELPAELSDLPKIRIRLADNATPGPSTFGRRETLEDFVRTLRSLVAELERRREIEHLHVFLASPVSASIAFGSCWPKDNAAPSLTIYHRTDGHYLPAIDLPFTSQEH